MAQKKKKYVTMTLRPNLEYGRSVRRGKSGTIYHFQVLTPTKVWIEDLDELQDPKSEQYEKWLMPYTSKEE